MDAVDLPEPAVIRQASPEEATGAPNERDFTALGASFGGNRG